MDLIRVEEAGKKIPELLYDVILFRAVSGTESSLPGQGHLYDTYLETPSEVQGRKGTRPKVRSW